MLRRDQLESPDDYLLTFLPQDNGHLTERAWIMRSIRNTIIQVLALALVTFECFSQVTTAQDLPEVTVLGGKSSWEGFPDSVAQGSVIKLNVRNLYLLDRRAHGKMILFLDGMPLKGLYPVSRDTVADTVGFQFRRTEGGKQTWDVLERFGKSVRELKVSVGPEDGYPVSSSLFMTFVFYDPVSLTVISVLLVALCAAFILLAARTDILRDSGPSPSPTTRKSFSLGRCQMAWWFFVVFSSVMLVRLVTGQLPAIPGSVLTLLGIAGGTGLGALAIDVSKRSQALLKIGSLKIQIATTLNQMQQLEALLNAQPPPANSTDLKGELLKVQLSATQSQSELDVLMKSTQPLTTVGFPADILSDADGISFHRFQVFVWTIVLGIIFFLSALRVLQLMDIDTSLLALMGISSGTYLGFKLPEK
jgi:hypothetical protein